MRNADIDFARFCFENRQYEKAKEIFLNNDMLYEAGFSSLLSGNQKGAKLIWKEVKDPCPATGWGLIILDILDEKSFVKGPGYFQTRAFFEVYLNLFIENKLYDWADSMIESYKFFTRSNCEVPKFIARVLSFWGYAPLVHEFAEIAKKTCVFDPEIHFIEAETFLAEEKYNQAYDAIKETLKVAPNYFPAMKMKAMLENSGFVL